MKLPSNDQVAAALRHGGTYAGGIFTAFALIGVLPAEQGKAAIADIQQIVDHLSAAFGAFSNLVVIVGPALGVLMAKFAAASASLKGQLTAVTTNPKVQIEGQIIAPKEVAEAVPSPKVVAPPQE